MLRLAGFVFACLALVLHGGEPPPRVFLAGDSTVATYKRSSPIKGWGQYLQPYFAGTAQIENRAVGGTSSKTYFEEGHWQRLLAERPGMVLIQFGNNDAGTPGAPGVTQPAGEFRDNLRRYVRTARESGATPVLVTPAQARLFDAKGELVDPLAPYVAAMRKVAEEEHVPLLDLHAASAAAFRKLGAAKCSELGSTPADFIHFNERGAEMMAGLVAEEIRRALPELAARMGRAPGAGGN